MHNENDAGDDASSSALYHIVGTRGIYMSDKADLDRGEATSGEDGTNSGKRPSKRTPEANFNIKLLGSTACDPSAGKGPMTVV